MLPRADLVLVPSNIDLLLKVDPQPLDMQVVEGEGGYAHNEEVHALVQ